MHMIGPSRSLQRRDALLNAVRMARFSHGLRCPRCGMGEVQRWGGFSGRQRYRCRCCLRTFSDLTGTPAAYRKKIALWVRYAGCLAESMSVRSAARALGIDPSTAFRWRHALLGQLAGRRAESLAGHIELGWVRFAYSQKGQRALDRPARHRGLAPGREFLPPRVSVAALCDRLGHAVTALSLAPRPTVMDLDRVLAGALDGSPSVIA